MKTRSWILGAAATVTGLVAAQAQVRTIGFNFGSTSSTLAATSGSLVNFSIGSFSVLNTVGTLTTNPNNASASTGYAGASGGFNYDNAAPNGAFNATSSGYYSVTITPNAGFRVVLNDFDFGAMSVTTTGPVSYALRSSIDSFAADITSGSFTANSTWALKNNSFTAVTGALSTAVTLRLYTYGGSGVVSGTSNINIDDVALSVTVPEASDCALYGCAAIVGFTWWRRSKKSVKQA